MKRYNAFGFEIRCRLEDVYNWGLQDCWLSNLVSKSYRNERMYKMQMDDSEEDGSPKRVR